LCADGKRSIVPGADGKRVSASFSSYETCNIDVSGSMQLTGGQSITRRVKIRDRAGKAAVQQAIAEADDQEILGSFLVLTKSNVPRVARAFASENITENQDTEGRAFMAPDGSVYFDAWGIFMASAISADGVEMQWTKRRYQSHCCCAWRNATMGGSLLQRNGNNPVASGSLAAVLNPMQPAPVVTAQVIERGSDSDSTEKRIRQLTKLFDDGIITQSEFDQKKTELLAQM
jgi:hypothetical protein